jgi:Cu2+-exporting ATPase
VLRFAYSVEYQSEHPIAVGIVEKAEEKAIEREEISDFEAMKGKGIRAKVGDRSIKVVSPGYLEESGIEQPESEEEQSIGTRVFVLEEDRVIGSILLSDQIRDASKEAVRSLKEMGIGCWMLTGDNEKTAKEVSSALHLDGYFAEVLPDEKEAKIRELQEEGRYVAMTGDGVNDAPALARADIGIAIGSGTDVAAETADIILVNSDPSDVVALIHFGRKTYKKMVQNLIWASGYNIIAIPLAAGVLYSFGIMISPAVGAILMSMSTVIVAFNAKLLKVA